VWTVSERLILHIEVPEYNCEDLQEMADEYREGDLLEILLEESMKMDVGVTFVSQPGEKCLNSEFDVISRTCRIVGAEIRGDD